jgi:hypothetical protein
MTGRVRFRALLVGGLLAAMPALAHGSSLRFFGHGVTAPDLDRVKIRIDDSALPADPGPPVDVGASDFTIEFWMRAMAADNTAGPVACGFNIDWIFGNILIDRDRFNQDRKYGVSIAGGEVVFGVSGDGTGDATLCSSTQVLDDAWHHVALQRRRSDGRLWLYVDGALEAELDGPDGDVSYPDDGVPGDYCGGPCTNSDPFIVLGAEKHDAGESFPSYAGLLDELRFSDTLRYAGSSFPVPGGPFAPDTNTVGLYHFDVETAGPCTGPAVDSSTANPTDGNCRFGGAAPAGPVYDPDAPFPPFAAVPIPAISALARTVLALLIALAAASPGGGRTRPCHSAAAHHPSSQSCSPSTASDEALRRDRRHVRELSSRGIPRAALPARTQPGPVR